MVRGDDQTSEWDFLPGGGKVSELVRNTDWTGTNLGGPVLWPLTLRTAAALMLASSEPAFIGWGPDLISLYNDGYLSILGSKPPGIGRPFKELWPELWGELRPVIERTLAGEVQHFTKMPLRVERRVQPDGFYDFTCSPLRDDRGSIAGFYCAARETTAYWLEKRRHNLVLTASERLVTTRSLNDVVEVLRQTAREAVGADGIAVVLKDGNECSYVAEDAISPLWCGRRFPADACVSGWAMRHAETVAIEDVRCDPRIPQDAYAPTFVRSLIMVPIGRPEPVAALGAYWSDVIDHDQSTIDRLESLARLASIAIENSRLGEARDRAAALGSAQNRILELAVTDASLKDTLEAIVREVETISTGGVLGTILLLDETGSCLRHGAGPSMPAEYTAAIDGMPIGPEAGSCGTAAFRNEPVFVTDIASDPLWSDYRDLALAHGLRSCWSVPIRSADGKVLGTFAMYHGEPRDPLPVDLELTNFVVHTAAVVIERDRTETAWRQSEARHRQIVEGAEDYAIVTYDAQGVITSWNTGAERLLGHVAGEVLGRPGALIFTPEDNASGAYEREFERARRQGRAVNERWHVRKDGSRFWASGLMLPLAHDHGGFLNIFRDRTAEHEAGAALRESEDRLRFFGELDVRLSGCANAIDAMAAATELLGRRLETSRCAYADVDKDNNRFWIRSDYTAAGVASSVGEYLLELFGPRAAADMRQGQTLVIRDMQNELEANSGRGMFQSIGIEAIVCCPLVKDGRLTAMMAAHQEKPRNWTIGEINLIGEVVERCWAHVERVGAEARLRESEERLRLAVDNADVGFWDLDLVNDRLIWPDRTKAMFGIFSDTPVSMQDFYDGLHPDDREATSAAFAAAADPHKRALYDVEYRTIGKEDGIVRWVAARGRGIFDQSDRCLRVAGTAIDVTQRKNAELALADREAQLRELNQSLERRVVERTAELAASERRFRAIFDTTFQLTGLASVDGRIVVVNQAALDAVDAKMDDVVSLYMWDSPWWVHSEDEREKLKAGVARVARGEFVRYASDLVMPDRSTRLFDFSMKPVLGEDGQPIGLVAEGRDVTDQRRAEDQLRQSQKMEAMGQPTGGVAHDFNNLLTPIVGALDMLQRRGIGSEREQRLISGAAQSAERAKILVQRLLAFARRQPLQPLPVDISKLVNGMGELVASTTGPQITVVVDAPDDLPAAMADPNQVEMALLNLAVNARDAMPEGGTLRISARFENVKAVHRAKLRPGFYVCLSVADTGRGMDEATLARAVEPFFSTKGLGKGTGLGLSMVHGLALQLDGALTIESKPGLGTHVELWLPRSPAVAPVNEPSVKIAMMGDERGTALLVDDEELVRASTADMLIDLGYKVIEAASGEEAMHLLKRGEPFDLLVTDHLMPGVSGTELARVVRTMRPGVPVLLVSGYGEREGLDPDLPRLTKPFREDELAASISDLRN